MEAAIFTGSMSEFTSLESAIMRRLLQRTLEAASDGRPRGAPRILAMSQSQDGDTLTITVLYEYRS